MEPPTRILVVDDDPALRWTTTRVLTRAGYTVDAADTGEEGLRLAAEYKPDLALLDVVLPGIDGLEVCRRIKADPALGSIYILLFSAKRIDTLEQAEGLELGADGYIIRPVSNRELLARVEAMLRLKRAEDDLRARSLELAQRVRELDCLYSIAHLAQRSAALPEILQAATDLLPPAWRYPEIACACITLGGRLYQSSRCQGRGCSLNSGCSAPCRISTPIVIGGQQSGVVGVCYTELRPEADEGPFSCAERQLIEALAGQLARLIEHIQADEAVQWSEEKFHSVFQQSHEGITLVDAGGTIVEWNQAMERFTGLPAVTVVGRLLWDVQIDLFPEDGDTPQRRDAVRTQVLDAIQTGQVSWLAHPVERAYHHPDGSVRVLNLTTFRIETRRDFMLGGVIRDVTQSKEAEAALAREAGINAASAALASALIRTDSIDQVSSLVLEHACRLTGSASGFAGYVEPSKGYLVVPTLADKIWGECQVINHDRSFEHFRGLWNWVIDQRQPLLTNTPADHPTSIGTPPGHIPIRRFLAVPAVANDVLMGEIVLANSDRDYTEFDLELVQRLASLYAVAIQRSHTEQALRESEQRFRSLMESAPDAMLLIDAQGRIAFANAQAEASFDYVRAELLGQPVELLIPELVTAAQGHDLLDDEPGVIPWAAGVPQALQARRRDGSRFPVDVKLSPLMMDAELLVTASVRDVTEREEARTALQRAHDELEDRVQARTAELAEANRGLHAEIDRRQEAEQALRESEARFRQIATHIDEALWMTDVETGEFLYVSPVFREMAGLPQAPPATDPRPLIKIVHPEDRERVTKALANSQDGYDLECRLRYGDGSVRWVHLRSFPIRDQAGHVYRIAGLAHDITAAREAQAAMIQNERLAMAGRLAASLAHEINNPLQSAIGCLDLVQESLDDGQDPAPFLSVVEDELERTARIVAQLRTLSRPSLQRKRDLVDLNALLDQVLVLAKKQLTSSGIRTVRSTTQDLPQLLLSTDEMRQVFLNLVLNAVDAMPEGGELEVRVARADPDGVIVRLADTGKGMTRDTLHQLFDPFYTTKPDGLGLGLFITQNIVRAHGGRISVDSGVGEGAAFTIWLPLHPRDDEDADTDGQEMV
ncbi:MAG TPA: PAS domain S-box protein [Anaerolineae bacterium]|nr:PAS domain S-box protein [Anaerolineae bacterium]